METITIHKAKTQLSKLIEKVCKGEEIVIARGKTPVAKLVALPAARKRSGLLGCGKERFPTLPTPLTR